MGLVLVFSVYFGIYCFADVDTYLETKEIVRLYDFYDLKVGENETAVYILGDSFVSYSIYSPLLNQQLSERGFDISEYNLAIQGGVPIMHSLQVQNIIDSKPSLVIIGVSYRHLADGNYWIEERVSLVKDRLKIREDSFYLYSNYQIDDINSDLSIWYSKKFLMSALEYKLTNSNKSIVVKNSVYNDYHGLNYTRPSMQHSYEEIVAAAQDPNNSFRAKITSESTQNKEALLYMINVLEDAGIPVILINAPLHPLLSENISDESRQNLHDFLDSTGVTWYDMEFSMNEKYFIDIYHLDDRGALKFTPYVTDMIIQELS